LPGTQEHYPQCPEAMIVTLAQSGDRAAFADLIRRHQQDIRSFMRRCCRDPTLADDLAQQVFVTLWLKIRTLKKADSFGPWLHRLAINTWLLHRRKNDALAHAAALQHHEPSMRAPAGLAIDLDNALAELDDAQRLCVVLSYQQGMSHGEIAAATALPLGTVKSHIQRGGKRLREILSAYRATAETEQRNDH